MGMPITIEAVDEVASTDLFDEVFSYFRRIDERFSTFKETSEITAINNQQVAEADWSAEMKEVMALAEQTRQQTDGYFSILKPDGTYDTSGLVKGWAIWHAGKIMFDRGCKNFFVDAGSDIQTFGLNEDGQKWSVGIKNPFKEDEIVKTVYLSGEGVATSGTYLRGEHIYNPKTGEVANDIVSLTVIGPNIYEADRFATAAFVMGEDGIKFIEQLDGFEGYAIDKDGLGTSTSNFNKYLTQ